MMRNATKENPAYCAPFKPSKLFRNKYYLSYTCTAKSHLPFEVHINVQKKVHHVNLKLFASMEFQL
jgi:hypothetical protein